jgi:hypothetical protein
MIIKPDATILRILYEEEKNSYNANHAKTLSETMFVVCLQAARTIFELKRKTPLKKFENLRDTCP